MEGRGRLCPSKIVSSSPVRNRGETAQVRVDDELRGKREREREREREVFYLSAEYSFTHAHTLVANERPRWKRRRTIRAKFLGLMRTGLAYLVFAATTVISNKHLITNTNFHSAIFVSSLGSWFGWIVSLGMVWSKRTTLRTIDIEKSGPVSVLRIGLATACSLAAANMAYFYLSLAFIQVLKAFAPVITFGVLIAFGLDRHNTKILVALCVIVCGSLIACYGEMHFTLMGLLCMLIAEVSEAMRSVGIQLLLVNRKMGLIEGMYYFLSRDVNIFNVFNGDF